MNIVVESNPYTPPEIRDDHSGSLSAIDRRFLFLLLPPLIPSTVHMTVRIFIPAGETLYLALFTLGAIIPAWMWSQSMIDRLRLSFLKTYLLTCFVWGTVLLSALLSPTLLNWAVG